MKERVLITGASGFVGYHLIEQALLNGLEVYAAVRKSSSVEHLKTFNIQYTYPDYLNIDALIKDIEQQQYSYIIHAAGLTSAKTDEQYNLVNATYTYNLALAATRAGHKIKKLVFLSSLAALGPLPALSGMIEDDTQPNPVTAYGRSKLLAEQKLATLPQLPLITLRPTAVYGPRDTGIFILLKQFSKGIEPYIGKIEQQLSFVYVKDLAKLSVDALTSPLTQKAYNISDGNAYGRYQLAGYSKQVLNKKTIKVHLPLVLVKLLGAFLQLIYARSVKSPALNIEKLKELTAPNWACNINNAQAHLNYLPQYDLKKGLADTFAWYKQNHWL
jgi:nucleoside-diphosphate-sugar epimerase